MRNTTKYLQSLFIVLLIGFGIGPGNATANEVAVIPLVRSANDGVRTVTSNGKVWMDRNLGALRPATKNADPDAYGSLYQWGRSGDGHHFRLSPTLAGPSSIDTPNIVFFYTVSTSPFDWRSPPNDSLWQGEAGINNPCPAGFRLPTIDEFLVEQGTWTDQTANGAIESPLKLPAAGFRNSITGTIELLGSTGVYWTSTVSGTDAIAFLFGPLGSSSFSTSRADGASVRCIKD